MSKLTIEEAISRVNKYCGYGDCDVDVIEAVISDNERAGATCAGECRECRADHLIKLLKSIDIESEPKASPLPDGVSWPRFEDGELVKFGDTVVGKGGNEIEVTNFLFGDYYFSLNRICYFNYGDLIKRGNKDTLEDIASDAKLSAQEYCFKHEIDLDNRFSPQEESEAVQRHLGERLQNLKEVE